MQNLETSFTVQTNDACGPIQVIMIDMTLAHQPSYFAQLHGLYHSSTMIGAYFTVSDTLADLNKIGTTNQAIMWVPFPRMDCSAMPTVDNGVQQPIQKAKVSGNANNADFTTQLVMNIEKYGSHCATAGSLFCEGVVVSQINPDNSKHIFMATTTHKFTFNNGFDAGLLTQPLLSEGSVSATNGGAKSIIIDNLTQTSGNHHSLLNGVQVGLSRIMFMVDKDRLGNTMLSYYPTKVYATLTSSNTFFCSP